MLGEGGDNSRRAVTRADNKIMPIGVSKQQMQHVAMLHLPVRKSDCFGAVYRIPAIVFANNKPSVSLSGAYVLTSSLT